MLQYVSVAECISALHAFKASRMSSFNRHFTQVNLYATPTKTYTQTCPSNQRHLGSINVHVGCGSRIPHFCLPVVQPLLDHVILLRLSVDAADLLRGRWAGAGPPMWWTCITKPYDMTWWTGISTLQYSMVDLQDQTLWYSMAELYHQRYTDIPWWTCMTKP